MALATLVHGPESSRISYTPVGAVAAGEVVVVGAMVCVAERPIAAGVQGTLQTEGTATFPKATGGGTANTLGQQVYWEADPGRISVDPEDGNPLGHVALASADGDATVLVKFHPYVAITIEVGG